MAARRVRIKGIANIPQRRKPITAANGIEPEEPINVDGNKLQEISEEPNLNITHEAHANESDIIDKDISSNCSSASSSEHKESTQSADVHATTEKSNTTPIESEIGDVVVTPHLQNEDKIQENHISYTDVNSVDLDKNIKVKQIETNKVPNIRRKFLKPPVCINLLNRKAKENIEIKAEPNEENVPECTNINLNEVEISTNNASSSVLIQKAEQPVEAIIPILASPKIQPRDSTKSGSDTEYQHPPPSPTKLLNRRIKAVPKLHQRRTSFSIGSASESEDDSRRSCSRIRNDSVCSVASGVNECQTTNEATSPTRKECTTIQRKCRKTEQTRKFAEARREFNMKFYNGKPDKQKLTMIDLIFYNPATSPMSYSNRNRKSTLTDDLNDTKDDIKSGIDSKPDEEKIDDPQPLSESDNEIPAPQIKVGPNGEIVVDEKSLVIENAETKRSREALQLSKLVNGDEDTSYGIYRRIKRSKEWTKDETLRFYRALNTIGTDFTMMCELFPHRTRRELKMKFKKEERLNQSLVDKAVMQPTEFDITDLRRELEMEARKAEEKKKRAEETKILRASLSEQKKIIKRSGKIKGIQRNPEYFAGKVAVKKEPTKKRKKSAYEAIKSGINGILSDSDEDVQDSTLPSPTDANHEDSDLENETNISNILKPTRYGRVPKTRVHDISDCGERAKRKKRKVSNSNDNNPQKSNLEPGSIMMVMSKTANNKLMYKVYIVTDTQTKQQITLEPNIIENLAGMGIDKSEIENKICDIEAHNIFTISAQECPAGVEGETNMLQSNNLEKELNNISTEFGYPKLPETTPNFSNHLNEIKISGDSIIFPFDECLTPTAPNQNITVSHEDNKMIVVTEDNKKCVLTT